MLAEIVCWLLIVAAVLAGLVVAIVLIGSFLPRSHVVSRSLDTAQPRQKVWQVITDFAGVPSWHSGVLKVERMPDRNGHEVWRETYKGNFQIQLEITQAVAPERLVRTIADEKGPFSGRWEFVLTEEGAGSRLTITEHGVIANPFIRFMARLLMDPAKYLEQYLQGLGRKLAENGR